MPQHILVVDDDSLMRRSLGLQLEEAGYRVSTSGSAEQALALAHRDRPDLILLDLGLPGMDGLDALAHFRQESDVAVIFVTARRQDIDMVLGLELGADDFITKPFNPDVLLSRVKAVLRRSTPATAGPAASGCIIVGDLTIDPAAHTVSVGGKPVETSPKEFALLYALALNAGQVLSVDELLARAWGDEYSGEPQVVYVNIRWLRAKIEDDPEQPARIVNVRGVGYKLVPG